MVTELRKYIDSGGSYREGVSLLRKCTHNLNEWTELASFAEKSFAPTWAEKRLDVLLRQYCTELERSVIPQDSHKIPQDFHNIPQVPGIKVEKVEAIEPPIIVALRQEEREARTARRAIHLTLDETTDRKLLTEKVKSVRAHTQRIDEIWSIIEKWDGGKGVLPALGSTGDERDAAQEVDELHRKMKSITPRISRLKGFLKDEKLPLSKIERYKRELTEKEAEMKLITQKLTTVGKH